MLLEQDEFGKYEPKENLYLRYNIKLISNV